MWEFVLSVWKVEVANYPILLMQAAALLGVFSLVLMVSKSSEAMLHSRATFYGWTVGLTGFVLLGMAFQLMNLPSKPYLGSDLLFLSGMLGGLRGGAIGWTLIVGARLLFGGTHQAAAFLLDMTLMVGGGIFMHYRLGRRPITSFGWRDIGSAWLVRVAFTMLSISLIYAFQLVPPMVNARVLVLHALSSGLSLMIIACVLALLRSDARERESRARAFAASHTNLLTGLPNRRALGELLERLLAADGRQHVLMTFQVANLAEMARALGHDWTDHLWAQLSVALTQGQASQLVEAFHPLCFQLNDLSLTVVLQDTSLEWMEQQQLASKVQAEAVAALRATHAAYVSLQLRIGVSNVRMNSQANAASILRDLNFALQSNEQMVRYFHESFAEQADKDEDVRRLLIDWIRTASPPMQYQPKFHLLTRHVCGAEALLRAHPVNGNLLPPPYVIEIATRHQLLSQFEWCTLEVVGRDIQRCLAAGCPIPLSVNISATTLTLPLFGDRVLSFLELLHVPPRLLYVEITESGHVPDVETVRTNIAVLQGAGVGLSLDDFGTGYSALTTLATIPFTEVKIDHSMISRIDQPRMREAVSLALESATRYNATLVAEGVETEDQSTLLLEMGVLFGQGYLFSRAVPMDDLIRMARRRAAFRVDGALKSPRSDRI
ncbi:EAL domain-containing protein [Variovorax sp. NFACC27]|uniref:EAL domain-containing protein n=1 Tax=unclassified Variovorax TaxID=663243 RepID=UPI0008967875|nr:EAL domain, c-di-GMP-specific phosphodiesterase class I (or its enzymatically inactive variant) [Variovorax sp. NFACC28]SEG62033.1 EAL domain, c-di-GMP-specific phosphodiesterase class I (or its enzymatically inactive variant) [Variovorax sp. NFACC29]SFC62863.1 EAL domain, c-di-GMP-specific phosphodiesterase class I (or its enzymatically inactive variant) [Variovorax sp. NFACC26]SFG68917.1 EAL domain, c-di-GMP-specific phosphodiesterase class I (or its enzymatically inactive variant) [Variovo